MNSQDGKFPDYLAAEHVVPGSDADPTPLFTRLRATPHASNDAPIDVRLSDCLEEIGRIQDVLTVATIALQFENGAFAGEVRQVVEHVEHAVTMVYREIAGARLFLAEHHADHAGQARLHLSDLTGALPTVRMSEADRARLAQDAARAKEAVERMTAAIRRAA